MVQLRKNVIRSVSIWPMTDRGADAGEDATDEKENVRWRDWGQYVRDGGQPDGKQKAPATTVHVGQLSDDRCGQHARCKTTIHCSSGTGDFHIALSLISYSGYIKWKLVSHDIREYTIWIHIFCRKIGVFRIIFWGILYGNLRYRTTIDHLPSMNNDVPAWVRYSSEQTRSNYNTSCWSSCTHTMHATNIENRKRYASVASVVP